MHIMRFRVRTFWPISPRTAVGSRLEMQISSMYVYGWSVIASYQGAQQSTSMENETSFGKNEKTHQESIDEYTNKRSAGCLNISISSFFPSLTPMKWSERQRKRVTRSTSTWARGRPQQIFSKSEEYAPDAKKLMIQDEAYTSKTCSLCGIINQK